MSESPESLPPSHWAGLLREGPDDEARWRALDALRHAGTPEETIGSFLEALTDRYWRVRALAVHAVYDLILDGDELATGAEIIEAIGSALGDESLTVSCHAAHALEALGPHALSSIARLRQAAEEGPEELRDAASEALASIAA